MKNVTKMSVLAGAVLLLAGCGTSGVDHLAQAEKGQIFPEMGAHHRAISTSSDEAQEYFDQGLTWYYAFNHEEAIRSFAKAASLDPESPMPWWGIALAEGPNYNDPQMTELRNAGAWSALQQALARIDGANPVERALIEALEARYENPAPEEREDLEEAFAQAMGEVWAEYPDDSDVGTIYAEAMMVRTPWKLYTVEGEPQPDTPHIVETLEQVMELDPGNPGANHLYIHAVEPSETPGRGIPAADRLSDAVAGSGHLLHMPSHIYVKTGHWERAMVQNQRAMIADERYRGLSPEQVIQHLYMVHNAHMLAYASMMNGREEEAMRAARAMWSDIPEDSLEMVAPYVDKWMCSVYDVQKRFGRWDDLLAEEAPPEFMPITRATWRAHRAVAYAAKKDIEAAEAEYAEFRAEYEALPEDLMWDDDAARKVLDVSDYFVQGEIALQKGEMEEAAELLEKAAAIEDTLGYGEPPQWLQPVRHTLGAVHLVSGNFEEAERAYREDLGKWPDNGWSLYGLGRALEGQGRLAEASEVRAQYETMWASADEQTTTSCKCIPST